MTEAKQPDFSDGLRLTYVGSKPKEFYAYSIKKLVNILNKTTENNGYESNNELHQIIHHFALNVIEKYQTELLLQYYINLCG